MKTDEEKAAGRASGFGADRSKIQIVGDFDEPMALIEPDALSAADLVALLRANPRAALEAVGLAKIAGRREGVTFCGATRTSTRPTIEGKRVGRYGPLGFVLEADVPAREGAVDEALRAAGWILVDG